MDIQKSVIVCHIAKNLLHCQKLLVVRKPTLPGTSRKDVLLPPLSALCSQEMLSYSYFEFPPFKCLSINSFQHPPRLSQFSHLKTLQRKASIENHRNRHYDYDHHDHHWRVFAMKLVQLISLWSQPFCHLSPPSTKSSSTKELQLSLSSNNSRYVHVVESWNNHSRFLLTKLRMISICDYTCRGGLLDLEDIILHSDMSISSCHSDLELEYFVALCSKCIALPPCLLNTLLKKMSTFDRFPLKSFWIEMDDKRPDVNPHIHQQCWLGSTRNPEIREKSCSNKSGRNPARTNAPGGK